MNIFACALANLWKQFKFCQFFNKSIHNVEQFQTEFLF